MPVSGDWEAKAARLQAAFERLEIAPTAEDRLPYISLMPEILRGLLLMGGMRAGRSPHHEGAPPNTIRRELAALAKRAEALRAVIRRLHKPAIDAVALRPKWPASWDTQLSILMTVVAHAEVPDLPANAGLGAPTKTMARQIAQAVADHYRGLTDKKPTISTKDGKATGPFLDLLAEVFDTLDISARPESQARAVIRALRAQ